MKRMQLFRLTLACVLALGMLAGLHLIAAHALSEHGSATVAPLSGAPSITIDTPESGAVLTQTPQSITMTYACNSSLCFGSFIVEAVSVTTTGEAGPYYLASWLTTTDTGVVYTYTWDLPDEDYTPAVLIARSLSVGDHRGVSEPVTVYVDTQAPTALLTLSHTYVDNVPITVSWQVTDGSGEVAYALNYRRVGDQAPIRWLPPTGWLTQTGEMSAVFSESIALGHTYEFLLHACDKANNCDESRKSIRVGPYRLYLPLTLREHPPMWKRGVGSTGIALRSPVGCGESTWYAGTNSEGVWRSTNSAQTWSRIADLQLEAYPIAPNPAVDCTEAFVAVWGEGVYHLDETSSALVTENLGEPFVYGLVLRDGTLYAGTDSLGIYKTGIDNVNWQPVNTGIDADDLRIRSLFSIGDTLYAGARRCSLYISTGNGETWTKQTVITDTIACNDAQVWSVANVEATLYAGLGLNRGLHYSATNVWKQVDSIPSTTIWGLAYDGQNALYVSAYGAGVYRCTVDGDGVIDEIEGCRSAAPGLGTQNTRELYIHNNLLVAGSDDGVWRLPLVPSP